MQHWRQSTKNTLVELYSEATLWKMILDLLQYLQNKDHQHHKWRQHKVMDIISRLPGCAGQASDAVSAKTQVKMEDVPKLLKIPKSECPDIRVRLPRHKWPKSLSSMEDPVVPLERSSFGRTVMGKAIWENPVEIRLEEGFQLGLLIRTPGKTLFLSVYVDDIKLAGKQQNMDPMWTLLDVDITQQRSRFGRTNIIPWPCIPGMHSKTMWNKQRYCWQLQNHVWIQHFRRSNWKITMLGKSAYFFVVIWHGRLCQEMCGTILWAGEQNESTTLQSINSRLWWPPLQRRRNEICWRIVKNMLSNCSEMLKLGTYWTTRYSMVSEQTCTIDHKMDPSLWQTIISFDLLHSSHKRTQTILLCGKQCRTMQTGTLSRLRLCRRSWGSKIHFWRNIVHFRKPYVCINRLDA